MAIYTVGHGKTYSNPQDAMDDIVVATGGVSFTEEYVIDIFSDTYTTGAWGAVLVIHDVLPTNLYKLKIQSHPGETVYFDCSIAGAAIGSGIVGTQIVVDDSLSFVEIDGINFFSSYTAPGNFALSGYGILPNLEMGLGHNYSKNWKISNCTFGSRLHHIDLQGVENIFFDNYTTLGFAAYPISPISLISSTRGFKGTFSAKNTIWYGEAGPEVVGAPGETIDIVLEHCIVWGGFRGFKFRNNSVDDFDYTIRLTVKNSIIHCDGASLLYSMPFIQADILAPLNCNRFILVDSDYNCYSGGYVMFADFGHTGLMEEGDPWHNISNCWNLEDWQQKFGRDLHSIEIDPLFTDVTGQFMETPDFTLLDTSPCRGAGSPHTYLGLNGEIRSESVDIGPDQYTDYRPHTSTGVYYLNQSFIPIVEFRDNGSLFDPFDIQDVKIYNPNDVLISTQSPVRISVGRYTLGSPVTLNLLGEWYHQWNWQAEGGDPYISQDRYITVLAARVRAAITRNKPIATKRGIPPNQANNTKQLLDVTISGPKATRRGGSTLGR